MQHHQFERPQATGVRWMIFALGCGISWTVYLHRYTFALIKPALQEEFDLDLVELGVLDTLFSVCYMVFQFPAGIMADVIGVHGFLGGILVIWSLGLGMHAWAPTMAALWGARIIFGAGQSAAFASISRLGKTWFPTSIRTTVLGWMGIFFARMGGACSYVLVATVLMGFLGFDWRTAVYLLVGWGLLLALLHFSIFRNSPRQHPWANQIEADLIEEVDTSTDVRAAVPKRLSVREMFSRMSPRSIANLVCLNLQSTLSTIADNIYSHWIPLFLYSVYALNYKDMGILSALPLLGGACGGAVGGFLNDRFIVSTGNRRWSRTLVALTGKGVAGALILGALALFYDRPYIFCSILFFVKFFGDWSLATSWGTVTDIGGKTTASVFAFNNSVASTGTILAPLMYGAVAQYMGWPNVFLIVGIVYLLCAASWLFVDCTIPVIREDELPARISDRGRMGDQTETGIERRAADRDAETGIQERLPDDDSATGIEEG